MAITTTTAAATTRKGISLWLYFTLSISLLTLLFSLSSTSPNSSSLLHLPSDLRRHYFAGTFIKLQQPPTINLFAIQSHPQQQQQASSDPVFLLHGLGLSSFSFRHVISSLSRAGIPAVAIDLPGSGFSDKIEDGGKWGGPLSWVFDVLGEIKEKGVFWAFDRLVETGQVPDVEKNAMEDGGYVAELMSRLAGQTFDIMSKRKPIHLVVHDSAWAAVVNWVSMNPSLVRSVTLLDSSPAESPAFLFKVIETRIIGNLIVKSHVLFHWLVKLCCLRSVDGNEAAEMYRLLMKEGDVKRGIVDFGKGLNYSFDLREWVNLQGVKDVKFQVLWSNSWSDRWIDEGRRIAGQIPKASFAWHSGGRWPQFRDLEMERRDPRTVVAIILGGGAGTHLFPLTKQRATPAVPIGGAYRLIDVPMSNCINSGINKVYILTQFNSASLNRHLARAYNFSNGVGFGDGFVEVLAATQTPGEAGKNWFQGTADAVRQFHWVFEDGRSKEIEDVLILSGDHLYRMDYMDFVQNHRQSGADITISCVPMDDRRASDFGLMKIDNKGKVISFCEKPKGEDLKDMEVDTTVLGLSREVAEKNPYIASMGVYLFKKELLLNLLRWRFPTANDFGSEIIPASAREYFMKAYLFNDYWEDIGTIRSFFEANLALTAHPPSFSFYDATKPMYTSRRNLPPTKIDNSKIVDSIVSHGSFLNNCFIEHSVVGIRSRITSNVHLKDTVMLGSDYYETESEIASLLAEGRVPLGIGENTKIKDCIIDKNARIGKNVIIANSDAVQEAERGAEGFYIRSGITILLKNSTIPDGFVV